jgi:hypothetical protein
MLGDGLRAFKLLPAFLATIFVGWHGSKPATRALACAEFYGQRLTRRGPSKSVQRLCGRCRATDVASAGQPMRALQIDFTSQDYLRTRSQALNSSDQIGFPIVGKVWITTTYEAAGPVLKDSQTFTLRKRRRFCRGSDGGCHVSFVRSPTTC